MGSAMKTGRDPELQDRSRELFARYKLQPTPPGSTVRSESAALLDRIGAGVSKRAAANRSAATPSPEAELVLRIIAQNLSLLRGASESFAALCDQDRSTRTNP